MDGSTNRRGAAHVDTAAVSAREAARDVARKAKREAAEVAGAATAQGKRFGQHAKSTGVRMVDEVKDVVAARMADVAQRLRAAEERGAASDGLLLEPLAGAAERVAAYLQARSGEELWRDFRSASARQPLLTYGSVFALGAAAAYAIKRTLFGETARGT